MRANFVKVIIIKGWDMDKVQIVIWIIQLVKLENPQNAVSIVPTIRIVVMEIAQFQGDLRHKTVAVLEYILIQIRHNIVLTI